MGSDICDFFSSFVKSKGSLHALLITVLLSFGLAATVGIVPTCISDRYARLHHGYDGKPCYHYEHSMMPKECMAGGDEAQTSSAWMSFAQNILIFLFNPVVGSQSDVQGRRPFLLASILLFCCPPAALVLMQRIPTLDPFWYYASNSMTGLVAYLAVIFSSLSDVSMEKYRAATFATIMAGFYSGFCFAPSLCLFLSHESVSCLSLILCITAFLYATVFFPETLPAYVAATAAAHHAARNNIESTLSSATTEDHDESGGSSSGHTIVTSRTPLLSIEQENTENCRRKRCRHSCLKVYRSSYFYKTIATVLRPLYEIQILFRDRYMSLITLGSFLSAAVYETDKSLVLFYIEEHLNVDDADIAQMFFFMGILGVLMQALGLQPLINLMGERGLLVVSFLSGTLHNFLYGAAKNKTVITVAISLSQLTKLNYPILSSMASQGVCTDEQGQVQGKSMHLVLDKRVLCIEKTILIYFHPLI
jgi:MFS family permease